MNKLEKELAQLGLEKEKEVRAAIESTYSNALEEIGERIKALMADEMTQSKVYRIEFQKALRGHVSAVLDSLRNSEYDSISEYIKGCYEDGFIGTLYTLNKSEIPIILPMAQEQIVKALILDSKISEGLYTRLGNDTKELKRRISAEISRGLSTAMPYADIARNIKNQSNMPISNAMNIVQTEGHRIQTGSALDVARKAKEKGTDLVKVWDSTLDSRTRPHHRALDGQVREIEECFEIAGLKAEAPGHFGTPSEDCRCRCAVLIKPRWDVDENFTKRNNETGELLEFRNVSDYYKFKEKYWGTVDKSGRSGIIKVRSDDVAELHKLGHLNTQPLENEFGKLKTDEIIITNERIAHIKERHPEDYALFEKYGRSSVENPDIIIKDSGHINTVFMVKHLPDTNLNVIVRLILESDNENYKNSVMTFYRIRNRNLKKLENKNKTLYKNE